MKFIYEEESEESQPTFGDVDVNQFFINSCGEFCQKHCNEKYQVICNRLGEPFSCWWRKQSADETIGKILPRVKKIEF